ncbi:MAG: TIGR03915 family putative DNA repair protein [Clostridium beijerinckii]|jgi:probable DNA metabolism protein|uniref:TIGR03915 family putative DNA repair protein n=1 Tax=Clostridium TaxID=1485 RepID=UPI001EEEE1A1|nr:MULTISPECIES: TIGR03915 family putative DNA repair protein [Clostridium]MCI1477857.1 TIGR03915 family putative DNA repair protein [Clostridium beijerinckii]MCI1577827.1 TIGR03915 family putative DNA repair protein [Clostridium beijerinckii]MCI1585881.1 TIGR03915 family putative DNA repair protein [Clostridium beijerinckii]MCI1620762.1 TIGR03915 family putative DNA repair protein [Clostridium beijerinckii]
MKIYLYDDTFEGLLTSIYDAFYSNGSPPTSIYGKSQTNTPLLLGNIVEISTDINKFKKVKNAIINKINFLSLKKIYFAFLSNYEDKGIIIFNYLKIAFKLGPDVHDFLNIDVIRLVDNITKKVLNECHRFEGFIRFNQIEEKLLYSSIEPDNDILELIGDHFKNRFPREYFIIHDISRQKALIYNTNFYEIIDMDMETYEKLKFHNDEYTDLWKTYFKATTIQERKNLKLQCRMMPKRYWKHILETKI